MLPFRSELFWDINIKTIDVEKHKHLIVERVISYGTLSEFRELLSLYNAEVIKQIVGTKTVLDPKTSSFVAWYFFKGLS